MIPLAKRRDRSDISSIALSALSAKGCAQAHSMPKIHIYLSRDERKYHSARGQNKCQKTQLLVHLTFTSLLMGCG